MNQKASFEDFNLWHFLQEIEWYDPLPICLIAFHITVTLTALMTRNHGNFQVILFLCLLLLVYFSENINEAAAHHWRFSRQQYFDNKGMFISLTFSVPILLNCMIMMASWLWQSSELMIRLKRAELKQKNLSHSESKSSNISSEDTRSHLIDNSSKHSSFDHVDSSDFFDHKIKGD